jgi:peptidoglycan hydrolase-like protein with peptidoglycan-binding domain
MSSLVSIVAARGPMRLGDPDGVDVLALQIALTQAGYRVATDRVFGPRTDRVVRQFQQQHGLLSDGVVGPRTAELLDAPHADLVAMAAPLSAHGWPHDDTASLIAFYGKPWEDEDLMTRVMPPFPVYYDGTLTSSLRVHVKVAPALSSALARIWMMAGRSAQSPLLRRVTHYSGAFNYRPVRGSSRLSTHAFAAAIDFDAARLPLGKGVPATDMPAEVVEAFRAAGAFWGGDYIGRKDPMHFQWAGE